MTTYQHTQIGYVLITAYCAVILALGVLTRNNHLHRIAIFGLVLMVVVLALFATLTVTIGDQKLQLRFGVGLIRKRFAVDEIMTCRVVKNPWYYGWGIRYTPRGWLYGVSGLQAVELVMRSGRRIRIGSDEPDVLAAALKAVMKQYWSQAPRNGDRGIRRR